MRESIYNNQFRESCMVKTRSENIEKIGLFELFWVCPLKDKTSAIL